MGDPITKTRLESFLGTVRSYLTSFNMGSFIWTPFVSIITLFWALKTGLFCLCQAQPSQKPIFLREDSQGGHLFDEKIEDAGRFFTHNGVLVAPPSIL